MTSIKNIAIIGSGNIANFLATQFLASQFQIKQVISRNAKTGKNLADRVNADFSTTFELKEPLDMVLICVPDNQIEACAGRLKDNGAIFCHCAGSVGMDVLNGFNRHGVLYPLQSISHKVNKQSLEVPFLIESNSEIGLAELGRLLDIMKFSYRKVDSKERLYYHLAAVFANNFTNAMIMATNEIMEKRQLDFSLLKPLISHTFEKLKEASAIENQTGPAKRNDLITLKKHTELLKNDIELSEIYKNISHYITEKFKH